MKSKKQENIDDGLDQEFEICSMMFSLRPPKGAISAEPKGEKEKNNIKIPSFYMMAQNFNTVLQMLWKYMHSIGAVAQNTSITNFANLPILLREIVERENNAEKDETPIAEVEFKITIRDKNNDETTKDITAKVFDHDHLNSLNDFRQHNNAALKILNESALQQIVNAYENVICELLRWHFHNNPEAAPKEKEISYRELLTFSSLEEAKRHVIEKEIENFLKRKDTDDQLKYIKDELKADIATHFKRINEFKEIILRRHAIVHAGGIASEEYIRRVSRVKGIDMSNIFEGKYIPLNAKYVINAWNVICSMGVILLHLVAKECARSKRSKNEEDEADTVLIHSSFNCIKNNQLDAAKYILSYANKLKLTKDASDLIVIVNLAQVHRWEGNIKECEKLLNSKDWSAYSSLFQLCVAALKDDETSFKTLLSEVVSQKAISITDLCEWPVFRLMRAKDSFQERINEAFGQEVKSVTDIFKPKVLDINPDNTLKALMDFLQRDSLSLECEPNDNCAIE